MKTIFAKFFSGSSRPSRGELLSAFFDGELDASDKQRFASTLSNDASRVDLEELRDIRGQLRDVPESFSDKLRFGLSDQGSHLGIARFVVGTVNKDEPHLAKLGRAVELSFGRRKTLRVCTSILPAQKADIDVRCVYLGQIDVIGTSVLRR